MSDHKDMHADGTANRVKGAAKELEGKVRARVGDATDDRSEHAKGLAQQAKGKVQKGIGKAQQKLDPNPGRDDI